MSVQVLTYTGSDNVKKILTVTDGANTSVLAAGTIPTDASNWVDDEYASSQSSNGAVLHVGSHIKRRCCSYSLYGNLPSSSGSFALSFSFFSSTGTSGGSISWANLITDFVTNGPGAGKIISCVGCTSATVSPTSFITAMQYAAASSVFKFYASGTDTEVFSLAESNFDGLSKNCSAYDITY